MTPLIKELVEGSRVTIQAIVGSVTRGVNAAGAPYLNIELRDSSGSISGKKWEVESKDDDVFVTGNIVEVHAEVIKYRENLQLKVLACRKLDEEDIDISRFVMAPPIPKKNLKNVSIRWLIPLKMKIVRRY